MQTMNTGINEHKKIQESQQTVTMKQEMTPTHIIIKLCNISDKQNILKPVRHKKNMLHTKEQR